MQIRLSPAAIHYITMISLPCLHVGLLLFGWYVAEHSGWFASIWEHELFRIIVPVLVLISLIFAGADLYSRLFGVKKFNAAFQQIEPISAATAKNHQVVHLQGVLIESEHLQAPLSQRQCSAYSLIAEHKVHRAVISANSTSQQEYWELIQQKIVATDFLLQTDEGIACIRSHGANIKIEPDRFHDEANYQKDQGGFLSAAENALRTRVLRYLGLAEKSYIGTYASDIRFIEGVLMAGERVAVVGCGRWISTHQQFPELVAQGIHQIFEITHSEQHPLQITDTKAVLHVTRRSVDGAS